MFVTMIVLEMQIIEDLHRTGMIVMQVATK